jgi:epoxyqueuosine reductase QueG
MNKEEIIRFIKNEINNNNHRLYFREPLVGFSSAEDELYNNIKEIVGKHHLYPRDILPEAKTVVSFFLPFSRELITGNRGEQVTEEWALSYIDGNGLINDTCEKLVEELKKSDIKAATQKATHGYDKTILAAAWSHRSAAYVSGLGRFGKNRMLITNAGGAGRYGSVVISESLEPDKRPEVDYCLSFSGKACSYCLKICPVGAFTDDSFDRFKCEKRVEEVNDSFPHLERCSVCGKCVVGPCAIFD